MCSLFAFCWFIFSSLSSLRTISNINFVIWNYLWFWKLFSFFNLTFRKLITWSIQRIFFSWFLFFLWFNRQSILFVFFLFFLRLITIYEAWFTWIYTSTITWILNFWQLRISCYPLLWFYLLFGAHFYYFKTLISTNN